MAITHVFEEHATLFFVSNATSVLTHICEKISFTSLVYKSKINFEFSSLTKTPILKVRKLIYAVVIKKYL